MFNQESLTWQWENPISLMYLLTNWWIFQACHVCLVTGGASAEATRVDLWSQTSYEFPRHRVGFPKWSYPTSRSCGTRPRRTPLPWRGFLCWVGMAPWCQRWRCVEKLGWQHLSMLNHRLVCKNAYARWLQDVLVYENRPCHIDDIHDICVFLDMLW